MRTLSRSNSPLCAPSPRRPDHIVLTSALPKTRSGKIMRRVLRKLIARESGALGDLSTLAEPDVVAELARRVEALPR